MAEKRVLEDHVVAGVANVRRQHWYPTAFRMVAGAFHAFNTVGYGVSGATLILGREVMMDIARKSGVGIQASSSIGLGAAFLGAVMLGIALLNAWAAISFLTARQASYWYLVVINLLSFVILAFLTVPSTPMQWAQLVLSFLVAFSMLFDAHVKAFYYKGPLAEAWWDEELRRRAKQGG